MLKKDHPAAIKKALNGCVECQANIAILQPVPFFNKKFMTIICCSIATTGGCMNKLEFISALKNEAAISKSDAAKVIQLFFDSISKALAKGDRVEIRGFCSFFVKEYKSYTGRNPKTGEKVTISPKRLPFFKCGKELKERVDY